MQALFFSGSRHGFLRDVTGGIVRPLGWRFSLHYPQVLPSSIAYATVAARAFPSYAGVDFLIETMARDLFGWSDVISLGRVCGHWLRGCLLS